MLHQPICPPLLKMTSTAGEPAWPFARHRRIAFFPITGGLPGGNATVSSLRSPPAKRHRRSWPLGRRVCVAAQIAVISVSCRGPAESSCGSGRRLARIRIRISASENPSGEGSKRRHHRLGNNAPSTRKQKESFSSGSTSTWYGLPDGTERIIERAVDFGVWTRPPRSRTAVPCGPASR